MEYPITHYSLDNNGNVMWNGSGVKTIYASDVLTIPVGITLYILNNQNWLNNGVIQNWGTIRNHQGRLTNSQTFVNYGQYLNSSEYSVYEGNPIRTGIHGEWIQDIPIQAYTGDSIKPNVTIIRPGTGTLIKDQDYVIKNYSNNIDAGTAIVTVEGIGNYGGTMTKVFTIAFGAIDLNNISTNDVYQYSNNIITIYQNGNYSITGTTTTDRVVIQSGVTATITLDSASIISSNHALDVSNGATVTLLLRKSNVLQTTGNNYTGLHVPVGSTILINSADSFGSSNGTVTANAGSYGAAIGSGRSSNSGTIIIAGGIVNANSSEGAAIGGGENGSNNTITISGGYVNANNNGTGAAIGGGRSGSSTITINGGYVNANNNGTGAAIGGGQYSSNSTVTINEGTINANGGNGSAAIGGGQSNGNDTIIITINGGIISANSKNGGAAIGSGYNSSGSGTIIIKGGTINANSGNESGNGAAIGGGMNGNNSSTITISGGTVNANSGNGGGSGIGSGMGGSIGTITITGGNINANNNMVGSGIGGGEYSGDIIITISGGIINATGNGYGAGIGGGRFGGGGSITINGGTVSAHAGIGAAGIGAGYSGNPGTLSMNGNAIIFASSVSDNSPKTKGILFTGNTGIMYGNVRLKQDATIPSGKTWTIASNQIFEISPYAVLTHNGMIYNNGTINNFGTITGSGQIIGNSVIDEDINDYNNFDIYEAEGKLTVADILDSQADLTGGIIGTIGFDDYDDEDDFYDPIIDVVVTDKETNTILYEIYIDETSNTYTSKQLIYFNDEVGEGGEFFPDIWESDGILSSIESIEEYRYQNGYIPSSPFLQDSIDVIVTVTVYNAKLNRIKIPGIGYIGFEEDSGLVSLLNNDLVLYPKIDCTITVSSPKCPCNDTWYMIKHPDSTKNSDLVIAAHRGVWGGELGAGAPENSRSSIQATSGKTSVIEVDVMQTHDHKLILSHDYTPKRLSEYSGSSYWFDMNYFYTSDGNNYKRNYKLRKRNGLISNDRYLLFGDMLDILKKNNLVVLIDIKELLKSNQNGTCINCEYDPATPEGRQKIKESWIDILKRCIEIAVKKNALDYIAFKTAYTPEELTGNGGIPEKQLLKVRYMPMIQPSNKTDWDSDLKEHTIGLIDKWSLHSNNVTAVETNFRTLNDAYLKPLNIDDKSYGSLLDYVVNEKGLRPGIFSEEPVGPKGLVSRWASWFMKDSRRDIRGDHYRLMNVSYFRTAVITTDRYDVWHQIDSIYNSLSFSSGVIANFEEDVSLGTDVVNITTESIIIRYILGSIIINGLNKDDMDNDIILYDTQERLIYKDKVKNAPQMIIPKTLPVGIYILKLSGNRQVTVKLIVNQ
jgi:hypothetical protein